MSKAAIVYWSGTGNTELMAQKVLEGARAAGAEALIFQAADFSADKMDEFDAIAFGCPSMGAEQLEESEFEPMSQPADRDCGARRSPCSVPMAGATGNGCAPGSRLPCRWRTASGRAGDLQ